MIPHKLCFLKNFSNIRKKESPKKFSKLKCNMNNSKKLYNQYYNLNNFLNKIFTNQTYQ